MAKKKDSNSTPLEDINYVTTYNLPLSMVQRNKARIENASKIVDEIIGSRGAQDSPNKGGISPVSVLARATSATLKHADSDTGANGKFVSGTGIRTIKFDTLSPGETELVQSLSRVLQDRFTLMPEYRAVVSMIPELRRVIRMLARDILNRDEFTKRSIKNPFSSTTIKDEKTVEKINKIIMEDCVDRYDIEPKLRRWIEASLTEGAHPVAIYPYQTIIEQVMHSPGVSVTAGAHLIPKKGKTSRESTIFVDFEATSAESSLFVPNLFGDDEVLKTSTESVKSYESMSERAASVMRKVIPDYLAEEVYSEMIDDVENKLFSLERKYNFAEVLDDFGMDERSNESFDPKVAEKIRESIKKGRTAYNDNQRLDAVRGKLAPLVDLIDSNIQFVPPEKAALNIARKTNSRRSDYQTVQKVQRNAPDGTPAPLFSFYNPDDANRKLSTVNSEKTSTGQWTDFQKDWEKTNLDKEVLIVEYDPELTIPVVVGGEHIGYYVLEFEAFYGPEYRARKKLGSFTDLVRGLGMGDDKSVISTMNAVGDTDPLSSSLFTPLPVVAGSQLMMSSVQGMTDEDRKLESLKKIVLQTVSEKVKDKGIVDDKRFKDAIAALIRQGYIVNKKIIMSYIPADNMVYFSRKQDVDGMPISVLDGSLFYCYMYIASKVSSMMIKTVKASDKEKLLVNMGLTGQLNYTLSEIEKSLSTRNVNVQSFFGNVGQVIRNAAVYQRLKIPVVDGEKLYDVEQLEKMNDISPDDDWTEKLLHSVLTGMDVQTSMISSLDESDFARSYTVTSLDYRSSILDAQGAYDKDATKLVRLLCKYRQIKLPSDYTTREKEANPNKKLDDSISLDDIEVKFTVPVYLSVSTISDQLSAAQSLIDSISAIVVGDASDEDLSQETAKYLKKELFKKFANILDWKEVDTIIKDSESKVEELILKRVKGKMIRKAIDGKTEVGDENGGGGGFGGSGEETGSGGSEEGGDDSGGGNSFSF